MPVVSAEKLPDLTRPDRTLAGLDLGSRTIGVAISDRSLKFAHPRQVIRRGKFSIDAGLLVDCFRREDVCAAVIGLPVNMNGGESPRSQAVRAFVRNFGRISPLPFVLWDERLSTVAAERALIEMDVSRRKRRGRIDSVAAAFILQGVLDWLRAPWP